MQQDTKMTISRLLLIICLAQGKKEPVMIKYPNKIQKTHRSLLQIAIQAKQEL